MVNGPGQKKSGNSERRKYFRYQLIYSPKEARLTIENHDYKVMDISSEGLRFLVDSDIQFEKEIHGTLTLSDGESRVIEGTIVWRHESEIGLKFKAVLHDI